MSIIVGLTGLAGAGKNTAANWLVEEKGFVQLAFADAIRDYLLKLNPYMNPRAAWGGWKLNEFVEKYGWEAAKREPEVRRMLQTFGTEIGRDMDQNIWVKLLARKILKEKYLDRDINLVITDVRFENEADFIRNLRGSLIEIIRPDLQKTEVHKHTSENQPKLTYDYLHNNSTPEQIGRSLWDFINRLFIEQNSKSLKSFQRTEAFRTLLS